MDTTPPQAFRGLGMEYLRRRLRPTMVVVVVDMVTAVRVGMEIMAVRRITRGMHRRVSLHTKTMEGNTVGRPPDIKDEIAGHMMMGVASAVVVAMATDRG